MNLSSLPRSTRRTFAILSAAIALAGARAQNAAPSSANASPAFYTLSLDNYVISASRTPQDPRYTPSSVSVVPLAALDVAQLPTLQSALEQQPGVTLYNNGGMGGLSTILLRGASVHQTLFVVDGVRMNDRSATYQNFLGGADLGGLDRIEVLRGPQSTLYGSSAMGGVILLETAHGSGPASGTIAATAGSFQSFGGNAAVEGAQGSFGYSASFGRFETDNDRPLNSFRGSNYSARLEFQANDRVLMGATFRGEDSHYEEPGSILFLSPGTVDSSNYLTTAYGQMKLGDSLTSRLTLASHLRDYVFTSSFGVSPVRNVREILDWQNTWEATSRAQVVAGANLEQSDYTVSGARTSDRVEAGYVSAVVRLLDTVTLTGGGRYDDFRSVGDAVTGRVGVAWLPHAGTKLRATYGTGFSAPGSDDVYGVPSYGQLPNPNLKPEKSSGWDAGIEQTFLNGTGTASVTYFQNRFRDLFDYETVDFVTFEGHTINRSRATTEGWELAVASGLGAYVRTRASYTYLEARDDVTGARLSRRPRHTGDAEITVQAAKPWMVGVGLHFVADRLEGASPMEDYTSVRVFTSYAIRAGLLLKVRVENALDEAYEETNGYPALPRAVFGSVEWRF